MNKIMSKRNLVLVGSIAVVGVPLAWYGYELSRGKSPRQIHEEHLHDPKESKNIMKDKVKESNGNQDGTSWRSWLDWDSDKIDQSAQKEMDKSTTQIKEKLDNTNKKIDREVSNSKLGKEAQDKAEAVKTSAKDSSWFGWMWGSDGKPKNNEEAVHKSIRNISENVPKKVEKEVDWIKKTTREAADGGREATRAMVKDNTRAAQDLGQEAADKTDEKVQQGKDLAQHSKDTVYHYGVGLADKAEGVKASAKDSSWFGWMWGNDGGNEAASEMVKDNTRAAAGKMGQKIEEGKNAAQDAKPAVHHYGQDLSHQAGKKVEPGKEAAKSAWGDIRHLVAHEGHHVVHKVNENVEEGKNALHDTKHAFQQQGRELTDKAGQKMDQGTAKNAFDDTKGSVGKQGDELVENAKDVQSGWFGSNKPADR